jgi:CRISPR-associated endonuclease Csn1
MINPPERRLTVGNTPCPVSHPEYELFRAYQFINNITFGSKDTRLNDAQRQVVLELINKNDRNFDFEKVSTALNLSYEIFNYDNKFKVPGNPTHKRIKPFFTDEQWDLHRHDIWHCFYFYEDQDLLAEKLVRTYGLTKENAEKAAKQQLEDGYGSVSLKAIRNILPFLERGFSIQQQLC